MKKQYKNILLKIKRIGIARGKFLKECKDDMYAKFWELFFVFVFKKYMHDNSFGSIFIFLAL